MNLKYILEVKKCLPVKDPQETATYGLPGDSFGKDFYPQDLENSLFPQYLNRDMGKANKTRPERLSECNELMPWMAQKGWGANKHQGSTANPIVM